MTLDTDFISKDAEFEGGGFWSIAEIRGNENMHKVLALKSLKAETEFRHQGGIQSLTHWQNGSVRKFT